MSRTLHRTVVAAAVLMLVVGPAAAGERAADPAKVNKRLAMTKNAERDLVKRTVADVEARARLLELYDKRDLLAAEHLQEISAFHLRLEELSTDYEATPAMFEDAVARYRRSRARWQKRFARLLAAMKHETTAKQWRVLADFELRKFNERELAYAKTERRR